MERRALGKGLGALIPEKEPALQVAPLPEGGGVARVPISAIRPNPFQPRERFDNETMAELINSIREKGIIQPVLVRRKGDVYELIAGERRFRAAQELGMTEIPVIIRDAHDQDSLELSLIENIQRQDLNPIEEAHAFQYLIDKFALTQEAVSDVLGKARVSVTNTLRLLSLPLEVQEELQNGRISFAHGRALLELSDANMQRKLAQEAISKSLSVRELENIIKSRRPRRLRGTHAAAADTYVTVMQDQLQQCLGTKVRISKSRKRGHITIDFYSQADLERIVTRITGGKQG